MLRGVRVVEGADLERLCGVTHRGFESLPLSHNPMNTAVAGLPTIENRYCAQKCHVIDLGKLPFFYLFV